MNYNSSWEIIEGRLQDFIYEKVLTEYKRSEIGGDVELIDSRIISSLSLINLLSGIEAEFGIDILFEEVGLEDFTTINKIVRSVKKSCEIAK